MDLNRRKLLKLSSAGLLAGLAGCTDGGSVSDPTSESTTVQTTEADPSTETTTEIETTEQTTQTTTTQESIAELGETLVYTAGDKELGFTVSRAQLQDAIVTASSNLLSSTVPDNQNHSFLRLLVEMENRGDERVTTPSNLVFTMDGTQYEQTYTGYTDNQYQSYTEILPGNRMSGWLVYSIPPREVEGRLVVNFSRVGEAVTGEWRFNVGDIERETYDYTSLSTGETISFGTDSTNYELSALGAEEAQSYQYSSSGYEYEEEAREGNKYVFVTVRAENTGETTVYVPSIYDLTLRTGSSQYEPSIYMGNNGYEGGEVSAGVQRNGVVLFEVPQAASEFELRASLTRNIAATWSL